MPMMITRLGHGQSRRIALEQAEEPVEPFPRPAGPGLVDASHVAAHHLPLPAAGELHRRGVGNGLDDCGEVGPNADRTGVYEVSAGHGPSTIIARMALEEYDRPRLGPGCLLGTRFVRPSAATTGHGRSATAAHRKTISIRRRIVPCGCRLRPDSSTGVTMQIAALFVLEESR